MTKGNTLSSDIELVKEIEQLKLKQKLLLQALKNKDQRSKTEKIILKIYSQISFLVEIFKEANSKEKEDETDESKEKSEITEDPILKRIEVLETIVLEKFEKLNETIATLSNESKLSSQNTSLNSNDEVENSLKESLKSPPSPGFEIDSKIEDVSNSPSEKPKKKGLFSL